MADALEAVQFEDGTEIVKQGAKGDDFFVILEVGMMLCGISALLQTLAVQIQTRQEHDYLTIGASYTCTCTIL